MIEFLSTRDRKASLIYAEELIKKHPALYQQLLNMHKAEQLYLNKKAQHDQKK
jgi:ABC-type nitrate/sulfonate/bicarbonate transport system substrate-binding protein